MAKFRMPKRLVLVEWLDAVSVGGAGWKSWKKVIRQEPVLVCSVGFVVREEPDFITLSAHIVSDGDMDGDVSITRKMIQRIYKLKKGRPK